MKTGRNILIAAVVALFASTLAMGGTVAIWTGGAGGNTMVNFLTGTGIPGYSFSIVTTADLETPGFLTAGGYTNLLVTRQGAGFGTGLSALAAANVDAWVNPNNVTLFLFDLADSFGLDNPEAPAPNPNAVRLLTNAINFQSVAPHGYIGEFNGAATALTSGLPLFQTYLGLVPGQVTGYPGISGTPYPPFTITQPGNPITAGLSNGFNVGDNSPFPIMSTGVPSANVFATWTLADGSTVPVIESSIPRNLFAVPEPGTLVLLGLGLGGMCLFGRRFRS